MAQIDIKEATIKFFDGTLGTATLDSVAADSDLIVTAISKHIGTDKISIVLVNPAAPSAALSVGLVGRDITINLATSTASAITSTAAAVKAAMDGNASIAALVTVALETAGTGVVSAIAKTTLDGQKFAEVIFTDGDFSYTRTKPREFVLNRGVLNTVKNADDEPYSINLDALWEYITASTGDTPTMEDILDKVGEASSWVTTSNDPCQPYSVDIEVHNAPDCTGVEDEILMFEEFFYETLDHSLRDGSITMTGRGNRIKPTARRVATADIA